MARLANKLLFFTTSPRTPSKMIPEIKLLCERFSGERWNTNTQKAFVNALAESDFFEGSGSPNNKAFSARDRVNRAPKALGFVDLKPRINLTDAGREFVYGNRPQEIFLRQLLKFQLPSPYHVENQEIEGTFYVRPYLEMLRLVHDLGYLTFDEFKIFAIQLTDYRNYDLVKNKILDFRDNAREHRGEYRRFSDEIWEEEVRNIFANLIAEGRTKIRENEDDGIGKFIKTKKSNMRDYADAGFRYLRYSGLIAIEQKGHSIVIAQDKASEVEYILENVERAPVFIDDERQFKQYLFAADEPRLYTDNRENIISSISGETAVFARENFDDMPLGRLKDFRDGILARNKESILNDRINKIKSYGLYNEIIDMFTGIKNNEYYDTPLMLEYNTWRAMTMIDGGLIKGNLNFDDIGEPLSTASGNMPDIECDYGDFALSVEVTMQAGQRQYESEGESVARHYGQLKERMGKETYCLFIAPKVNPATLAHFYGLNHIAIELYGGKSKIIPLGLDQFVQLVRNSYSLQNQTSRSDIKSFLDEVIEEGEISSDENDWENRIQTCVDEWLVA